MNRRTRITSAAAAAALVALAASGCEALDPSPATITPILVTATDPLPVVPIVATETPPVTAVVQVTGADILPTQPTRTATATAPPPMTMTPTFTPSPSDTPVDSEAGAAFAPVGMAPGDVQAVAACATVPQGPFAAIYESRTEIRDGLGCALAGATSASSAYQTFQNGAMVWLSSLGSPPQPTIYVLFNNGTYQRLNDTFQEGVDPDSAGQTPPEGLTEPVRGFGKVWRDAPGVRDGLGWATSGEIAGSAQVQLFERGEMMALSQTGQTVVAITGAPGMWSAH